MPSRTCSGIVETLDELVDARRRSNRERTPLQVMIQDPFLVTLELSSCSSRQYGSYPTV